MREVAFHMGLPKAAAGVWHPAVASVTPAQRDHTRSVFMSRIKKKLSYS